MCLMVLDIGILLTERQNENMQTDTGTNIIALLPVGNTKKLIIHSEEGCKQTKSTSLKTKLFFN